MIKFFRIIRQNLVTENKFSKYLIYAIGEIILVVIGILIAISINNWNIDRLEKKEVANFLEQIETELNWDIIHFNQTLSNIQRYTYYLDKVSDRKYDEIDLSQLPNSLAMNSSSKNFGLSYTKMLESGIIKHIENSQISKKLQTYYLVNCAKYNISIEFHANFVSDHIEGPLLLMLNHKRDFLVDPIEVIDQLENGKLMSLVNWQISSFEAQIPEIEKNITIAQELIGLITKK
ncbi:MAG: hypothetical protein K8F54_11890 [Altibacter sp.]|uniref:DUF6090 family protein n=1 Tax=Altibacter sp. TaxID=2024823 RepID=UPI001D8F7578|nr:DUF6090 family protein [Altibacter sp.]MBZ0328301.1 hypothetical protein [Altibacter sp.]